MHQNSLMIFEKYALEYIPHDSSVLEIGPDAMPSQFQKMARERTVLWETLEISEWLTRTTYVTSDPYNFPLPDAKFDVVLSGQVIEHVPYVWRWMKELHRVCKPGGHVITINPVTWFYHEAPVDCWRIYPEGMIALCKEAGLEVLLSEWESVELEKKARWIPSALRHKKVRMQRLSPLFDLLGRTFRSNFRGAFDTITVARRPMVEARREQT